MQVVADEFVDVLVGFFRGRRSEDIPDNEAHGPGYEMRDTIRVEKVESDLGRRVVTVNKQRDSVDRLHIRADFNDPERFIRDLRKGGLEKIKNFIFDYFSSPVN